MTTPTVPGYVVRGEFDFAVYESEQICDHQAAMDLVRERVVADLADLGARAVLREESTARTASELRHYVGKAANRLGQPTADPLTDPTRIEEVGEPLLAVIERLRAVEVAAADLVRKLDEHETRGYSHIRVGALRPLRDALGGAR